MKEKYDVVVLGGGPAGTLAALALKRRHPHLQLFICEASSYNTWRVGESLSPLAGQLFRSLGLWEAFQKINPLIAQGTCALWESDALIENEFIFQTEGQAWHLDRVKFDQWLLRECEKADITVLTECRYLRHRNGEEFQIDFGSNSGEFTIEAKYILDGMGRNSLFMKKEGEKRKVFDRLNAYSGLYTSEFQPSSISAYSLIEAVDNGWWYSSFLPNHQLIVSFMTDADMGKKAKLIHEEVFLEFLEKTKQTKKRIGSDARLTQLNSLSAASILQEKVVGQKWIAVGDAASTFDPLSSQGIYKSMRSGVFAAYALSDVLTKKANDFSKYERFIREEYQEYLRVKNDYYSRVKRWPGASFWQRRQHEKAMVLSV